MLSAEPRGGGENDGSADVLVCHIVDYPQGLIYSLFFLTHFLNESMFFCFLKSVKSKQQSKQGCCCPLLDSGQCCYLHENGSSDFKQSSGRTCTKHINYLPRAEYCKLSLWLSIKEWWFLQCRQSNKRLIEGCINSFQVLWCYTGWTQTAGKSPLVL